MARHSVCISVLEIVSLNASTARDKVFAGCQLQDGTIRKFAWLLHQAFSISALPDNNGAVVVLQSTRSDFGSRSRTIINEHGHGNFQVQRLNRCLEGLIQFLHLALRPKHHGATRQKASHNADGLAHQSTRIAAQVKHQAASSALLEVDHSQP